MSARESVISLSLPCRPTSSSSQPQHAMDEVLGHGASASTPAMSCLSLSLSTLPTGAPGFSPVLLASSRALQHHHHHHLRTMWRCLMHTLLPSRLRLSRRSLTLHSRCIHLLFRSLPFPRRDLSLLLLQVPRHSVLDLPLSRLAHSPPHSSQDHPLLLPVPHIHLPLLLPPSRVSTGSSTT